MRKLIVDVETTGLSAKYGDRMLEFCALDYETEETFTYSFNPERNIPTFITGLTNIKNEDVINLPKFAEEADNILSLLTDAELIIHNAEFDLSFIKNEFLLCKKPFKTSITTCTLKMARTKYPNQKNSLDALCERYKIDVSSRKFHTAKTDCELLLQVYKKLIL